MATAKTLLVVDDEETIHKALKRTLRREPYELLHAYDAAEASALLAQRPEIAGVLCDHYMPGTHGLELLMEIRRKHPHVVTVLLTAQADLRLVIAALNEGRVHRFFTKPWDPESLRAQLRELLLGVESPDAVRLREQAQKTEDRLREEMLPARDAASGAFLIDPPEVD
jgi:response regulator RpfG family c-di-GMP phosphodiesterase